jgi:5-methyltetrahydrofolate--homocysteine methyltransferase
MVDLGNLTAAIEMGDREAATVTTREAIRAGMEPRAILGAMTLAMDEVGRRFQACEIFVPEMLVSARAMKESVALLEPVLVEAGVEHRFTAVIGTVKGDIHDIGKNLVGMMWKGANIGVVDLGSNVPPATFVTAVREHRARVVGISALLTTTMVGMRQVIEALGQAGLGETRVIVGGAPITAEYAQSIGADAYAPDAAAAVDAVLRLVAPG